MLDVLKKWKERWLKCKDPEVLWRLVFFFCLAVLIFLHANMCWRLGAHVCKISFVLILAKIVRGIFVVKKKVIFPDWFNC